MNPHTKPPALPLKKPGEKRFCLIDGNHLIHRAFHAISAPLTTSKGEPTNALFGFTSIMLNVIELLEPECMAMTFDEKAPTFRHEMQEDYKGTRVKAPDELYVQIPRIREMCERFSIPIFSQGGFEADDFMGTLAKKAEEAGLTTYIVTGDRDTLQLVNEHTFVVFPHKGFKEPQLMDNAAVFEKYGVRPDQMIDYKALVGDSSDNIKGVEGIGPVAAEKLLKQYGTLEEIYSHLPEISEAMRHKLEKGTDDAQMAKKLSSIVMDVPCELDLKKASVRSFNFPALQKFCEEMEMLSLVRRIPKMAPAPEAQMSLF
jgi:DNA polymerase-1